MGAPYKILGYFRYVDDILILYNKKLTNIDLTLLDFNKIRPKITLYHGKGTKRKRKKISWTSQNSEQKTIYHIRSIKS
jgi:hypothetical protein